MRGCKCANLGSTFCPVHSVSTLLERRQVGERLWNFTSYALLRMLRRCLAVLGTEHAKAFTLKGFRAGHATELAVNGASWSQILMQGEWKSLAALRYIDADAVDASAASWEAVAGSSEEEAD